MDIGLEYWTVEDRTKQKAKKIRYKRSLSFLTVFPSATRQHKLKSIWNKRVQKASREIVTETMPN